MSIFQQFMRRLDDLPFEDPLEYRKARMVQTLMLGLLALCTLTIPLWEDPPSVVLLNLIAIIGILRALYILRRGRILPAIAMTAGIMQIGLLYVALIWGLRDSFDISLALALPLILVGLFLERRDTMLVAAITLFILLLVAYADDVLRIYPPPDPGRPMFGRTLTLVLVILTITFVLDRLRQIYRHSLSELCESNRRLQNQLAEGERTRQALLASEERFRLITEKSSEIIALINAEGQYVYISPAMQKIIGIDPETMLSATPLGYIHPEDADKIMTAWECVRNGQDAHAIFRHRHADGGWRTLESTGVAVQYRGSAHYVIIAHDITRRLEMEHGLAQSQKMEAIGRLAGGVAHDFNNLLVAINGYVELAGLNLPAGHPVQTDLRGVRKAAERARNLTRQLLTFAHRHPSDTRLSNLNDLVNDMATLLHRLIREDIELRLVLAPDLWPTMIDPVQFEQVIVNLVVNARDAMPEGGRLAIQTANITLDHDTLWKTTRLTPGNYVMLIVSDTGIGMDAETRRHIFEPFFTTKSPGAGTGLGLSTCYGIVARHGGDIWVYSEPEQGTSMKVYLPRAHGLPANASDSDSDGRALAGGAETILLVEDEPVVRNLATRILRTHGYTVLEAGDGADALHLLETPAGTQVALVLSDVVMPNMGGPALARWIIEHRPDMRILLMSGYSDQPVRLADASGAPIELLQKPFTVQELITQVRNVLDHKSIGSSS